MCVVGGTEGFEKGVFTHSRFKQGVERVPAFKFEVVVCARSGLEQGLEQG